MNNPRISIIAALGKNHELGRDNQLLFDIPEDRKHFRETTRGKPVIMGRKTAEHLVEFYTKGPLPGRTNIVVTRDSHYALEGFIIVHSLEEAIERAKEENVEEIFIVGGGEMYKLALGIANRLYLTLVDKDVPDADAFFPDYSEFKKVVDERASHDQNYSYTFKVLEK